MTRLSLPLHLLLRTRRTIRLPVNATSLLDPYFMDELYRSYDYFVLAALALMPSLISLGDNEDNLPLVSQHFSALS